MYYCVKQFYILIVHKIWEQLNFLVLYKRGLIIYGMYLRLHGHKNHIH